MKIGIGGGRESKWKPEQKRIARIIIRNLLCGTHRLSTPQIKSSFGYGKTILVSGHCHLGGVDIWAEEIAKELGIEVEKHPAPAKSWNDKLIVLEQTAFDSIYGYQDEKKLKGYRTRNIDMAKSCDVWYAIEAKGSCRRCYGTGHQPDRYGFSSGFSPKCKYCEGDGAYGGATWTLKYARDKLGKEVHKIVIN